MKRLGFHTLRDKATDTLGDKLSRQLQEDVAPKMSDEEAFSFAEFNAEDAERGGYSDYSYWKSTLRAFFQNKIAVFFLFVMVAVLLFTFIQPYLPGQKDPILIHNDQWGLPLNNIPPSKEFWFGTNSIGQDLWARIWAGTRTSLFIGFSVALVEAVVGILVGVLWGYVRKLDFFFTELYNVLDNIPQTLLLILISYVLKPGVSTIIFALSLTGWLGMAARVRMQFYRFKGQEYILAARTLGASDWRLMFKHIFPNSLGTIITGSVLVIPGVIFSESTLSYLGIVNLESSTMTSVGTLLSNGKNYLSTDPYIIFFPALFIALLEISFNLFGNGLRDAFNPSLRGVE